MTAGPLDLPRALTDLALQRPLFHSEADVQHALAWALHEDDPTRRLRLEYRPHLDEVLYVDILLVEPSNHRTALELKYWTKALTTSIGDEDFRLRTQGAHDICRYDYVKDLARVERLIAADVVDDGWVVAITNDPAYWSPGARPDTIDAAFRLDDGRTLTGELGWATAAGEGTTRGRSAVHRLAGSYELVWHHYSRVDGAGSTEFRHLTAHVTAPSPS